MTQAGAIAVEQPRILSDVEDALAELRRQDAGKAQLVKMRFYGGFTVEESAKATGRPVAEVRRHLRMAQAWLERQLDRTKRGASRVGAEGPANGDRKGNRRDFVSTCRYARTVSVRRIQIGGVFA